MFNLIGLTGIAEDAACNRIGSARVGKDEVGRYLSKPFHGFISTSFAKPIYDVAEHAFGIPREILTNPSHFEKEHKVYEPWGMTLRQILQTVGTELFRDNIDPDFWVKRARMSLNLDYQKYVFTDVRMPNEARMIRDAGGVITHVHRLVTSGQVRDHSSENQIEIMNEDLHIYNYGTIGELHCEINDLLRRGK